MKRLIIVSHWYLFFDKQKRVCFSVYAFIIFPDVELKKKTISISNYDLTSSLDGYDDNWSQLAWMQCNKERPQRENPMIIIVV